MFPSEQPIVSLFLQTSFSSLIQNNLSVSQQDFEGQRLAHTLTLSLSVAAGIASFAAGWWFVSLELLLHVFLVGLGLCALLVIPPWPYFKRHPIQWLSPLEKTSSSSSSTTTTGKKQPQTWWTFVKRILF